MLIMIHQQKQRDQRDVILTYLLVYGILIPIPAVQQNVHPRTTVDVLLLIQHVRPVNLRTRSMVMHVNHVPRQHIKIKEVKPNAYLGRHAVPVKRQQIHHHPLSIEHAKAVHPILFKNLVNLLEPHAHLGQHAALVKEQQIHHHPVPTEHVEIVQTIRFKHPVNLLVPHAHLGPHAMVTRTKPKHPPPPPIVNAHPEVPAPKTNTKPRYPLSPPTEIVKPAHPPNIQLLDPRLVNPIANKTNASAPQPMSLLQQVPLVPPTKPTFVPVVIPEKFW